MGYSNSKTAMNRVEPFLQLLLKAEEDIEFPTKESRRLLYMIRDGLAVAEKMPSSPYRSLKSIWKLKDKGDRILAEKRVRVSSSPEFNLAKVMQGMEIPQVTDLVGAIAYAVQHRAPSFSFPNFHPVGNPLIMITNWCSQNGYFITQSEPYLILTHGQANDSQDS